MAAPLQILLTLWVLASALNTTSALPQSGQKHAEVAPVVVWAQMSTGESSDSDFQSRFGEFADQSEQADGSEKEVVAVWPGPAWQKSDSPAVSERVGELSEDLVASESSRADQLASYVTRLTEQGFSSGDQLSFDESPTQSEQNSTPAEAEERSDNVAAETNAHGFGSPKISRSDDDIDDNERQHSRQAVLRRRRKRPIASGDNSALRRRQRPSADADTSDKSEDAVSSTASEQVDGGAADSDTEALKQRRRRIGVRRRRPLHSQPNQQRRRPVQQTASAAEEPTTQRPSRRRRPSQPPTTAAPTREQQSDSQSEGATKAVYFQPNPEEYPQYPPFAPREPTQAPQRPLQAPQSEYDGRQKPEVESQPSQFVSGLISNSARPDDDDGSDDSNSLSQMVTNLKLKLTEEKEQNENEIASDSSALPSLLEEHVTTRPLRELFDVLTRADLAKGSRSENYGPASLEETPDVPNQAATPPFQMPDIQPHQIHLPEQQNGRQRLRLQRPRVHPQRRPAAPQATSHSVPPQPAPATPTAERVVPSEVVYESGFSPIPSLSYFQAPPSPETAGPPQHPAPAPPQHPAPLPPSPSTFVSGERRPTPVQSRPTFAPPRPRPTVHHTIQRPTHPPRPAPPPEEQATNGGKVRFPGPEEPINAQEFGPPKPTTLLGQTPSGGPHHRVPHPPPSDDDRRRPLSGHLVAAPRPFGDSSHRPDNSSPSSVSGAVIAPTPLPPNQERPFVHPPQQHHNRLPTFGIKPTKRVPPKSFGGRPKPVFGRPHPDPSGQPPRGNSFERRPPGPAINQLTSGPLSKGQQQRLPPTTPGQKFNSRLPLQARPDDRHPPSQLPEQSGQQPLPLGLPRPPHGSPDSFGQQKPSGSFQQRPEGDTLHYGDLQNRPLQGNLQQKQQGETTHTQQKPHGDFQQKPQGDIQQRPQGDFQQRPQGPFQRPHGDFQQKPQGPFQRPHGDFQQGPQGDFQQRPPNHFQQKPQDDLQKRPHGDFQQRPQGPFQRPQGDLQQGPPNGFERRPPQHGAPHDQGRPPFGFQQRPTGAGDQARPAPEIQHGPAGGDVQNRPPFPGQHRPPTSHDGQRPPAGHQQQQGPPPGFQQRPPPGFQQRLEHQQRPQPGHQQRPQPGHQQRPQHGHQQPPQPGFASRPPPGFRPGPAGPGNFGQHAPGSGLPSSAHPRNPSSGPLAHFSRRRDQQAPGQLMFQRG